MLETRKREGDRVRISFSAQDHFIIKITIQERADTAQYLNAAQDLRCRQDGNILEDVLSLLQKKHK